MPLLFLLKTTKTKGVKTFIHKFCWVFKKRRGRLQNNSKNITAFTAKSVHKQQLATAVFFFVVAVFCKPSLPPTCSFYDCSNWHLIRQSQFLVLGSGSTGGKKKKNRHCPVTTFRAVVSTGVQQHQNYFCPFPVSKGRESRHCLFFQFLHILTPSSATAYHQVAQHSLSLSVRTGKLFLFLQMFFFFLSFQHYSFSSIFDVSLPAPSQLSAF